MNQFRITKHSASLVLMVGWVIVGPRNALNFFAGAWTSFAEQTALLTKTSVLAEKSFLNGMTVPSGVKVFFEAWNDETGLDPTVFSTNNSGYSESDKGGCFTFFIRRTLGRKGDAANEAEVLRHSCGVAGRRGIRPRTRLGLPRG